MSYRISVTIHNYYLCKNDQFLFKFSLFNLRSNCIVSYVRLAIQFGCNFFFNFLLYYDCSEDVEFCGYTVPHPAESKMHFRIQSRETPALEILKRGLKDLEKVCNHTMDLFEKEVKDFSKT